MTKNTANAKAIEEYILEAKKDMVVELDLAYLLGKHKAVVPEENLNQVSYTLLNTCMRLHKMAMAVGIDHVRVKRIGKEPGKAKEVLGKDFDRVMGICAMILRTSENIPTEDFQELFGLTKAQIWQSVPELIGKDGHKLFDVHTPIRKLVKRISDCNAGIDKPVV